ncbi:hypothetical protein [Streptomyces alboniger]|uniref:Uncharacterized protein n=1 Tax=Streptomyces alboniger TaxID=132473 RepID=A0A5J6HT22_STRAD|nr:hypothetical protein [Streptomyces alboniger]QEV19905.1 hypothetical protein CP975_22435 [Streptomyces alboniger]
MATRILPAVGDIEAARVLSACTGRLPDAVSAWAVVLAFRVWSAFSGAGGGVVLSPCGRACTFDEDK